MGSDPEALQADLNKICGWCAENSMLLNADKCVVLSFGRSSCHHNYTINGVILKHANEMRDLGITVDIDLTCKHS